MNNHAIQSTYFPEERLTEAEWFRQMGIVVPFSSKYKPNGNNRDNVHNDNSSPGGDYTPVVQKENREN